MAELIVVDDEADLRVMLADYLTMAGHGTRTAADGQELRLTQSRSHDPTARPAGRRTD